MATDLRAVVGWQLRGPPIVQAHRSPAHQLVLQRQRWLGSVRSSSSGSSGNRALATHAAGPAPARQRVGRLTSAVPEFDAQQLLRDMQLDGFGSADELSASMGKLPGIRQQGILQHGPQVAAHLRGLGIGRSELGPLFCRCPELFSWPAEERAGVLHSQLMRLGLSARQVARCFQKQPGSAASPSFEPAIALLAPLLLAGSKGGGRSGEQLLGDLLKGQPSALRLLQNGTESLQHNLDNLLQLGLSKQQVAKALPQSPTLIAKSPERLAKLEAVLQQELGANHQLWVKVLRSAPRAASCSEATLRQRAQALTAEFGKEEASRMVDVAPSLLVINTVVWRRAVAVWQQCGVADPRAVAHSNPQLLARDWLNPSRLANLRALQQWLPWEPSGAEMIACYGRYMIHSPTTLVGRLLYLEQLGLLPLLVADKLAARQEWREEQGLSGSKKAAGEPVFISVSDVATLALAQFTGLVDRALSQQQQDDDSLISSSNSAPSFEAFRKGSLLQLPAWQQLLSQAQADVVELERKLPPELVQKVVGRVRLN